MNDVWKVFCNFVGILMIGGVAIDLLLTGKLFMAILLTLGIILIDS